ncbi:MAG TPA: SGNH/GDSL hydrolase family protein [Terracidiphilus sp.]|jgi:lysophospholipase L1-like esterase|nr:SGNH/GDSL hydrolase family protein [Terracidiphilus sp.]
MYFASLFLTFCLAAGMPVRAANNSSFALRDGDRVMFYGDSITAQRFYTRFAEDFVVSRYPKLRISFFNAGVSGDTVEGGHAGDMETRVTRDVAPMHPSVVTIMLGMNDGHYTTEDEKNFRDYAVGYRKLIATLRAEVPGVRLLLICPSPYDEVAHPPAIEGYNSVMIRYGEFVAELGKEEKIPVVDFNHPMASAVARGMQIDRVVAGSLLPDRIHPSPAGHWILAAALTKGWNLDPVVSSASIDATTGAVGDQHNTAISDVHTTPEKVSWTELDQDLPLPLELNDPVAHFLFEASDLAAMNRQMLRVSDLTGSTYSLSIDGKKIGVFSREELNAGVNLALYSTPMEEQAKSIDWTSDDRSRISGARFSLLTEKEDDPTRQQAIEALDRLDRNMIDDEYKSAQPKPHVFELVRVGEQ